MRDKRPVDELSVEELERILAIRRREARMSQLQRMKRSGRVVDAGTMTPAKPTDSSIPPLATPPVNGHLAPSADADTSADVAIKPPQAEIAESTPVMPPALVSHGLPRFEDDADGVVYSAGGSRSGKAWKRFVNTALLLVEVAAVVGLIYISLNLLNAIGVLETETRTAQEMANATRMASVPTLAPTPTLRFEHVVLPGGHIYNETTGEGEINFEEIPSDIPAHLLVEVQNRLRRPIAPRPPQTPETALTINIPRLRVDQPIVQGTDWEALRQGVGQVLNGATPNNNTNNVVLAAHNDIYGELFKDLDQLEAGDQFFIQTATRTYTYVVSHWEIVDPTDVHVMESQGRPMVTLISCYPYRVNNKRIVVYADRVDA